MKRFTKYPELDGWFNEGLFVRRQFNGQHYSVAQQLWYVNRLRDRYFSNNGVGCIWSLGKVSGNADVPYIEKMGWLRGNVVDGFKHVPNTDVRDVMRAMVLCDANPLPKAHDIANVYGFAWEQFKYEFALGLYEMQKKKVGLRV